MKFMFGTLCIATIVFAAATPVEGKGCIKGAIAGGVAGHMAGHGKLGAAAGCAIGHHEASKNANKENVGQAQSSQKK